ncbi:MAG: 2-amino-4-hydroxy-6-hydroxymethyldihydropteridine diphosphokinase [Kiritimatiellae bacterium]|nr:2-amino-4-hydroxy-6-hydroxymethyldihydropteridine diphosphokinase [Kiritimatiellia bacterium]
MSDTATPTQAILSLGSNMGDREGWLAFARKRLDAHEAVTVTRASRIIETDPVDVPEPYRTQRYLNQILILRTTLTADALSTLIHALEDEAGRRRGKVRNLPRTLDIDLIAFGNVIRTDPVLTLPHPRAKERLFVLQPLAELLPGYRFPDDPSVTVTDLLARF